ncbi:MAG TPA: ACT domain-containing protein [Candidatus Gastranaerophilaceae bacterium]|nr:ACT domain-containing protein [Candidatus Gastranaerophilaceae bacterium]HPT41454.1 ACT domain-containing protein [Candidatus Gastranaerophilaceae bacterium]
MKEEKIIITISGTDKIGIVATITAILAKHCVNIEDIKQTLMQGHFVMFMLGDISASEHSFKEIKEALIQAGKEIQMEVWVQRKAIFDKMHTI